MKRFQGRSAEKAFSKLCSDKGVTCNNSYEDDHGWDHIVEFPLTLQSHVSSDMQMPMPAVFVQTKSNSGNLLNIKMKLSNAVKLARSTSPAFVLLRTGTDSGGKNEELWYAVHFWDALIGRVLKRVRKASLDCISEDNFHNLSFSFMMTSADVQADNALLPWMASTVTNVGRDYAAAKRYLHPNPEKIANMRIGPIGSIEELVDHQLGLTENIPLMSLRIYERRFGIEIPLSLPIPMNEVGWSKATMHAEPADQCDIRISGPDGSVIQVKGDVIAPAIPNLSEDQQKIRIRAPFFDIIWPLVGSSSFNARFNTETKQTPTELERLSRFISWSNKGGVDVRVSVRDNALFFGTVSLSHEDAEFFSALVEQIGILARLSEHLQTKLPQISITDFLEAKDVFNLCCFIKSKDLRLKWDFSDGQQCPQIDELIAMGAASAGDWIFAAIQRFRTTKLQHEGGTITIEFGDPFLLQPYAFQTNDAAALEHLEADFKRYVSKKGVLGISNILSEFGKSDNLKGS